MSDEKEKDSIVKKIYKVARSLVFSLMLFVVALFLIVYILISVPAFTNHVKDLALKELSELLGAKVEVENLRISPFNEVKLKGVSIYDLHGKKCLEVETLGAGISLRKLLWENKIELTYGEIIGLKGYIEQKEKDGELNIQFIIDALKSKDDQKEKKHFELALRNVVLRKSSIIFNRPWMPANSHIGLLDLSHLEIDNLAADITFPKISDNSVEADLRRLSFSLPGMIDIKKIALTGKFGEEGISINNLEIEFPSSRIFIPDIELHPEEGLSLVEAFKTRNHNLEISDSFITPSDFSFLLPALSRLPERMNLEVMVSGNPQDLSVDKFYFGNGGVAEVKLTGIIHSLSDIKRLSADIPEFNIYAGSSVFSVIASSLEKIPPRVKELILKTGELKLDGRISGSLEDSSALGKLNLTSDLARISVEGNYDKTGEAQHDFAGEINIGLLRLDEFLPESQIGDVKAFISAEGGINGKDPYGNLTLNVENFIFRNFSYEGFVLEAEKQGPEINGHLDMNNRIGEVAAIFAGNLSEEDRALSLDCTLRDLNLSEIIDMKGFNGYNISGEINAQGRGHDIGDIIGHLDLNDFSLRAPENGKTLTLHNLTLHSEPFEDIRKISLNSDWIDGTVEGNLRLKGIGPQIQNLAASIFPALVEMKTPPQPEHLSNLEFQFDIKEDNTLTEYFGLPVRLLVPISIEGNLDGENNRADLAIDIPYLQQGKDKLISDSRFSLIVDGNEGEADANIATTFPVKKGDLKLAVRLSGAENQFSTDLDWINTENSSFRGTLGLKGEVSRNPLSLSPELTVDFRRSMMSMGEAAWFIDPAKLVYKENRLEVSGLKLWHAGQFVEIDGVASASPEDVLTVRLADIDVDYIFDTLKINYVTFGGIATGEVTGRALFSKNPIAQTETLKIKDLTYNSALIGDCDASGRWNNAEKEIEIGADIYGDGHRRVKGRGGIWLGKDSLAFDLNADKVPVEFIQPFMAAFSSHVGGFASGDICLFGTFKDIDMTGKIFADSVAVKLDYTNTVYHGSDSVILHKGRIEIPSFRLYDKYDHSALLTGELTHRYFHDPSFTFRLSEAENFLCYDTSAELNPDWYGVLFGSGSAFIQGVPGMVDISADMTLTGNSSFTFVLSDMQFAEDYQFLTFTDKRKEAAKPPEPEETDFRALFKKKVSQETESLSQFAIDIRATVTPAVLFTLVMDPAAGDKITARGRGAMQVKYESNNDEMQLYGKYEIAEGNYNFSLQDIILRDFKIKEGSSISFNGNPLRADLDISAAYRVNTNLSDLDKSFSSDRDLTRTNVPVDAILSVSGNMQQPDITFDIELPTLTQDVERKVKSIISTDDMMNRQIIYLLALNRFYTPEYMGSTGNGGELAAVASSTISSQLSNMLGLLTDKVSVAPSFRSDKGDFSDIEVDVALSSRLLNNRLLINGNFGYRDKSTSNTTFIGDFDVEYLLTRNGNFRLKAYNHFNDQNYYLREALTTQGLGVVFRRDFGNLLKPREEKAADENKTEEKNDEEL